MDDKLCDCRKCTPATKDIKEWLACEHPERDGAWICDSCSTKIRAAVGVKDG